MSNNNMQNDRNTRPLVPNHALHPSHSQPLNTYSMRRSSLPSFHHRTRYGNSYASVGENLDSLDYAGSQQQPRQPSLRPSFSFTSDMDHNVGEFSGEQPASSLSLNASAAQQHQQQQPPYPRLSVPVTNFFHPDNGQKEGVTTRMSFISLNEMDDIDRTPMFSSSPPRQDYPTSPLAKQIFASSYDSTSDSTAEIRMQQQQRDQRQQQNELQQQRQQQRQQQQQRMQEQQEQQEQQEYTPLGIPYNIPQGRRQHGFIPRPSHSADMSVHLHPHSQPYSNSHREAPPQPPLQHHHHSRSHSPSPNTHSQAHTHPHRAHAPRPSSTAVTVPLLHTPAEDTATEIPGWKKFVIQWDIGNLGVPLGCFGFTAMWQAVTLFMGSPPWVYLIWYTMYALSTSIAVATFLCYLFRMIVFPGSLQMDFVNTRKLNFFYNVVLIGSLWCLTTPPPFQTVAQHRWTFIILGTYQLCLALYTFGEWLSSHAVPSLAHPTVFLHTIGYFMLTTIGAMAGLYEPAQFMFSLGGILWLVVFVTNFQHISSVLRARDETPQPTFFIFVGPPAQATFAALALKAAEDYYQDAPTGGFTKLLGPAAIKPWPFLAESMFCIDVFLYILMFRLLPQFISVPFAVSWWAYIFPMSACASCAIWRYFATGHWMWFDIAVVLISLSTGAMVIVSTFMLRSLFLGDFPKDESLLQKYRVMFHGSTRPTLRIRIPFMDFIREHIVRFERIVVE